MFIDEPGLQFLFSAMAGYGDQKAKGDMETFFAQIDRPRGIHLCGKPDWDFLLNLDMDVLSMDIYTNKDVFSSYAPAIRRFIDKGGIIVWGIVPTNIDPFRKSTVQNMESRMEETWNELARKGIDKAFLLSRSLLSPATCCLVNPDKEKTVDEAFVMVQELSRRLREKYGFGG